MLKFGLIGAGRIGRIHGDNVVARRDAQLVAVTDASPEVASVYAREVDAQAMDIQELLDRSDIEAVLICSPTDTHADYIERAATAGKAVFCEKPIDLSSERVRKLLDVVESLKPPIMIAFNRRFDPSLAEMQRRVAGGEIGEVEIISIVSRDFTAPPVSYVERSGGLFRDMMIHDLDMARFLFGEEPVEVQAYGSSLVDSDIGKAGDVDTAIVQMKTASGKLCQISNSRRATYGYDQRMEVFGSLGMVRSGNYHKTAVEISLAGGITHDPLKEFFLQRYEDAYRAELDAFIEVIKGNRPLTPSLYDGLRAQLIADAATESWKIGRPVKIPTGRG